MRQPRFGHEAFGGGARISWLRRSDLAWLVTGDGAVDMAPGG